MKATPLAIPDGILLEPKVFGDDRGLFFESFNQAKCGVAIGRQVIFVQDNHSRSVNNVLRGLHCRIQQSQGKLIRVVAVAVVTVGFATRNLFDYMFAGSLAHLFWILVAAGMCSVRPRSRLRQGQAISL